jgi:hypothetical protein
MSVQQRKFRNAEERKRIVEEAKEAMQNSGMFSRELPDVKKFVSVLEEFEKSTNGRQFDGTIELKELGVVISYCLPGRRILPHYARLSRIPVTRVDRSSQPALL